MTFLSALKHPARATFIAILLILAPCTGGWGQQDYNGLRSKNNVFVYDYANILSPGYEQQLNAELVAFKDTTSNVIVVVTHPDFFNEDAWKFATDLGHAWGVAGAEKDNGIVLVVKPKVGNQRGLTHIAVGYGLEGAIPDAISKRIVEGEMIPRFKANDYQGGIYNAVGVLKGLAAGEISEYAGGQQSAENPLYALFAVLFMFALFFGLMAMKARNYAKLNNLGFWAAWALLAQSSRTHSGSYRNFSGGSGFGGRSGGGGFGGFGGGGFGGGGAGGSW